MQRLAVQKIGEIIAEINGLGVPIITPKLSGLYAQLHLPIWRIQIHACKVTNQQYSPKLRCPLYCVAHYDVQIKYRLDLSVNHSATGRYRKGQSKVAEGRYR
jgi:hypothetical protein